MPISNARLSYVTGTGTSIAVDLFTGQATFGFVTEIRYKGTVVPYIYAIENFGSWDVDTEIDIYIANGETLASATETQVYEGINYGIVGNELFRFMTVTALAGNKFTLQDLLRGRRGDPSQARRHSTKENFFKIDKAFKYSKIPETMANTSTTFKLSNALNPLIFDSKSFAPYSGVSALPLAPTNIGFSDVSGDLNFNWVRANRSPMYWAGIEDAKNVEGIVQFKSTVLDETDAVVREFPINTVNAEQTYTVAQQTTDFGAAQDQFYISIVQQALNAGDGFARVVHAHFTPIMRTFFDAETTGNQAADTTKEWSTTNVTYNVDADDFLRMTVSTTAANKALKFDKKRLMRNSETTVKMRIDTVGSGTAKDVGRLLFRAFDTDETGIVFGFADDLTEIGFEEYIDGTNTELVTASLTDFQIDVWYFVKVRVWENRLKAKVWKAHRYEPADWDIDHHYIPVMTRLTGWSGIGQKTLTVNTDYDMIKMEVINDYNS